MNLYWHIDHGYFVARSRKHAADLMGARTRDVHEIGPDELARDVESVYDQTTGEPVRKTGAEWLAGGIARHPAGGCVIPTNGE